MKPYQLVFQNALLQSGKISAEIDMKRQTIENEGRNRFHARGFCFLDTCFLLSEMNHFDAVTPFIQRLRNHLFGFDTYRASRVIENRLLRHAQSPLVDCDRASRALFFTAATA